LILDIPQQFSGDVPTIAARLRNEKALSSRAFPGSWHDIHCLREAGWVDPGHTRRRRQGNRDLGYEGEPDAVATPTKKKPGIEFTDIERRLNTGFAKIRVPVEWGVGHAKNWRILTTRYRSDLSRIDTDIQAAIGLQKLNEQFADRRLSFDRIKKAVSE
jgi:hypothetical protein